MEAGGNGASRDVVFWLRAKPDPNNATQFRTLAQQIQQAQSGVTQAATATQSAATKAMDAVMKNSTANMKNYVAEFEKAVKAMETSFISSQTRMQNSAAATGNAIGGVNKSGRAGASTFGGRQSSGAEDATLMRFGQGAIEIGRGAGLLGLMSAENERRMLAGLMAIEGARSIGMGALHINRGFSNMSANMGAGVTAGMAMGAAGEASAAAGAGAGTVAIAPASIAALAAALTAALLGSYAYDAATGQRIGTTAGNATQSQLDWLGKKTGRWSDTYVGNFTTFGALSTLSGNGTGWTADDSGVNAAQSMKDALTENEKVLHNHMTRSMQLTGLKSALAEIEFTRAMRTAPGMNAAEVSAHFNQEAGRLGGNIQDTMDRTAGLIKQRAPDSLIERSQADTESSLRKVVSLREQERDLVQDIHQKELDGHRKVLSLLERKGAIFANQADELEADLNQAAINFGELSPAEQIEAMRAKDKASAGAPLTAMDRRYLRMFTSEERAQADAAAIANARDFYGSMGKGIQYQIGGLRNVAEDFNRQANNQQEVIHKHEINAKDVTDAVTRGVDDAKIHLERYIEAIVKDRIKSMNRGGLGVYK